MNCLKRAFGKFNLSPKAEACIAKEKKYNANNYAPLPIVLARGEGAYVWDVDGKKYLDGICHFSAMNQGHCHPRIRNKIIEQMHVATGLGRGAYHDKVGEATEFLCKTFGYDRSILMNTGVEAGETAIKFARRWAYEVKKVPDNQAWVLFGSGNFWGRTLSACGSSDDPDRYTHFGPFCPNFKILEYNNADAFEKELKENPNVAAIMLEPIQGEACVNIPHPDFLKRIRKLCDQHNVLLIIDEVQVGLGRTGKLLCQDHYGIKGDLVMLAKALSGGFFPISAVLGTNESFKSIVPGSHSSTYGGNPLACVTAIESVKVILDEGLIENARVMGDRLLNGLKKNLGDSKYAMNLRGKGLFIGVDINEDHGPKMIDLLMEIASKGLLIRHAKPTKFRIAPALTINESEADFIVDTVSSVMGRYGK